MKISWKGDFNDTMNILDKSHKILVKTRITQNKSRQSIHSYVVALTVPEYYFVADYCTLDTLWVYGVWKCNRIK